MVCHFYCKENSNLQFHSTGTYDNHVWRWCMCALRKYKKQHLIFLVCSTISVQLHWKHFQWGTTVAACSNNGWSSWKQIADKLKQQGNWEEASALKPPSTTRPPNCVQQWTQNAVKRVLYVRSALSKLCFWVPNGPKGQQWPNFWFWRPAELQLRYVALPARVISFPQCNYQRTSNCISFLIQSPSWNVVNEHICRCRIMQRFIPLLSRHDCECANDVRECVMKA